MNGSAWDEQYLDPRRYRTWPSEEMIRFLAPRVFDPGNPPRALDLGCGAGGNLWALLDHGFNAYGIDPSPQARARAGVTLHRHGYAYAPVYYGTAETIPFPDEFFDVVIETMTLQHVLGENRPVAFAECRRVLRPGGRLLSVHLASGTDYEDVFPGVPAAHLVLPSALLKEWTAAGFEVENSTVVIRQPVGRDIQTIYSVAHVVKPDPEDLVKA